MSKSLKKKFSTYPHSKLQKTWKTVDFFKVIHIIHTKNPHLCELLRVKKERTFWLVIMKTYICRKKGEKMLTFE